MISRKIAKNEKNNVENKKKKKFPTQIAFYL